jgi:hypothetical protein
LTPPLGLSRHALMSRAGLAGLVGLVLAVASGCPPVPPVPPVPPASCSTSSPPPVTACAQATPLRNGMPKNGMPKNGMPKNGLSAGSLGTNQRLLGVLASSPLSQGMFDDPELTKLLTLSSAVDLMDYITSCALDPCETIEVPSRPAFEGQLGLCSGTYAAWARSAGLPDPPSWRSEKPSSDCLERVSACVLARVNAINAQVVFSMRGQGMSLSAAVPVETQFREDRGTDIRSFQRCEAGCQGTDSLLRNCDWEPRFVGQCQMGEKVRLVVNHGKTPTRIRVCRGIHGCDDPDAGTGNMTPPLRDASNVVLVPFPPPYGGERIGRGVNEVSFACPTNGPRIGAQGTGYYSVMLGTDGAPLDPRTDVRLVDELGEPLAASPYDAYPAPEAAVFTYREGAFYGTIFPDPSQARSPGTAPIGAPGNADLAGDAPEAMLSGQQYACYSDIWSEGAAMLANRLCAGPTARVPGGCFVNQPGPCDPSEETRRRGTPNLCRATRDASGAPMAELCRSVPPSDDLRWRWSAPYTAYLNHPCDLFASEEACREAIGPGKIP